MEPRAATNFTGGHSEEVDHVSWNPTHPDLFCSTSQKEKRIVFWDARRMFLTFFVLHVYLFSQGFQKAVMLSHSLSSILQHGRVTRLMAAP
jgi:hypothetical protein